MAITDEQVKAFCKAFLEAPEFATFKKKVLDGLEAAYAAQFQSEGYYADVIKSLRVMHDSIITDAKEQFRDGIHETMPSKAADAIEALLAERDALNFELAARKEWPQARAEMLEELAKVRAERDALAARLAPAVLEIAVREVEKVIASANDSETVGAARWKALRAAIAAVRPHIEAMERERCAKIASGLCESCGGEGWLWAHELGIGLRNDDTKYSCDGQGESIACKIAAAIRSRK